MRIDEITNDGYVGNIENKTENNSNYREVVHNGNNMQLVVMNIPVGEEIGEEVHEDGDQFIRIEDGQAKLILDGEESLMNEGDATLIPSGMSHNVINIGEDDLKIYALYAPPEHEPDVIDVTKGDEKSHGH